MNIKLLLGLSAVILLAGAIALPSILSAKASNERIGDWFLTCNSDETKDSKIGNCMMQQNLEYGEGEKKGRLLNIAIARIKTEKGKETNTILTAPLGIMLQAGIGLQVDDDEKIIQIPLERCTSAGCVARFNVAKDVIDRFKKGKNINIYMKSPDSKNLKTAISLKGFSKAYKEVENAAF